MNYRKVFSWLLILWNVSAMAQSDTSFTIKGYILSAENLQPVPLASIAVVPSNKKFISNRQGAFVIQIKQQDSVFISAIGYTSLHLLTKTLIRENITDSITILLQPLAYELKGVKVISSNPKRDSIARIVAGILASDSLLNNYDRIYKRPKGTLYIGTGFIYDGFIQDLYNKFSKEGKDNIHFEEFVRYAIILKQVDERYNKKVIKRITAIPDDELDDFILFCKLDRQFIITASDYELFLAIKTCGDQYKK